MLTREQAKKLTEKALAFSTFPECDVRVNSLERAFVRFAVNGITTSGFTIEQSVSITSARDGKSGSATVDEFDDRPLREAVQRSEEIAMISPADPERPPSLVPQKYPEVENYPETTAAARNEVMIAQVRAIIEGAKSKNLTAAGLFERSTETEAIANKQGNFGYGRVGDAHLSATVRNSAGTSSGWAGQPAVRIEEIDGAAIANTAIEKCLRWSSPKRLDPGFYTVVLEPTAAGDLVDLRFDRALQARAVEEGRSFFSRKGGGTRLGEKLFPDFISLRTDPFDRRYSVLPWERPPFQNLSSDMYRPGSSSDDSIGMPCQRIAWIEKGMLKNFSYDRYWASKTGKPATALPRNLLLEGGAKELPELISSVERGLLVTRFWYIRPVNRQTGQFTGLTRDGLFLIENGKIISPVVNFRFNESRWRMLQNCIAVGKAQRVRGAEGLGMIAPPLVVKDFPFTSISDAV
jgi:predicted Zn-dependent protease